MARVAQERGYSKRYPPRYGESFKARIGQIWRNSIKENKPMKPIDILTGGKHSKNINNRICNGCGKKANAFRNKLSEKEYKISGLCQVCQDSVFGKD